MSNVNKFTEQPSYEEIVQKMQDIIDALGSATGANIDLSNLSATGEAHFQTPIRYTPANTSISNLTNTGKVTVSHLTCPSFNKYKTITLGASGTSYQAPADGWFSYVGSASSAGRVDFSSSVAMYDSRYTMPGEWCGANIRVAKGQSVTFYYNGTFSIGSFRFIYDIGTESEYS